MSLPEISRLLILLTVGLFLVTDAALGVWAPERMWSYASQRDYLLRALILALYVGFGLHLVAEWWGK